MDKVRVLAANAFRDVLHRRVVYVAMFLAVVGVLLMLSPLVFLRMAKEAGETEIAERVGASVVVEILSMWSSGAALIGLFIGAGWAWWRPALRPGTSTCSRPVCSRSRSASCSSTRCSSAR